MDYSQLSDQEINLLVAKIQHPDKTFIESKTRQPSVVMLNHINMWIDYCNNPADAWPIILEHGISFAFDKNEDEWVAWGDFAFDLAGWDMKEQPAEYKHHVNPLRAAMIVFLMMQESQHA
ncbi:phage protein NinX family protein [Cronobacter sakazakii]|uniref:phage protein NinX family protein n=1 Tax=Cronobacter sakazakii TaxID=28141 RepID=UPI000A1972B9|nr:phage protein NinX family protein [Cronobacter sakazakii]ELY5775167.1 DUF2591 family protein [Cronobacter sakazakii]KAB1030189.1 DUF2591 domain-containing protein [Cronobacter sakazakii]MCI0192141.1 DUF2591 domain-containing protein [Cronobacter sakazakii]MCI0209078.1 DUF2591 domain-containing protein [Cronobacter sakazakii]MCI0273280.1 DUF2591 domain-containing protein [Cronobacter sakazakii]